MKKIFIIFILMFTTTTLHADSNEQEYYWVDGGVKVLAFVGDPYGRVNEPVQYETAYTQRILLFHKDSGPGVYAFLLPGLVVKTETRWPIMIYKKGFFLLRKSLIRETEFHQKTSLKSETKKEPQPKRWFWEGGMQ